MTRQTSGDGMLRLFFSIFLLAMCWLLPLFAGADETILLLDNTKITGKLTHYYEGVLSIRLPNGTTMQLPAPKVKQVLFQLPKARKEYSTPEKTFKRMKDAALKGDIERYIECHSTYYQMFLNHQISMATPKKFLARLKKEWGSVKLEIVSSSTKGDTAVMKVRRKSADDEQEGEMHFVRENKEWKMILPL